MTSCCLMCGRPLRRELPLWQVLAWGSLTPPCLCPDCQARWQTTIAGDCHCWGCGRGLWTAGDPYHQPACWQGDHPYCGECQAWLAQYPAALIQHQALCPYEGDLRQWLHHYKYLGDIRQAQAPADRLRHIARRHPQATWLVLPSSPASLAQRRFHATAQVLLCAGIRPVCPLIYIGDGRKQATKTRQERLALDQVFALDETVLATCGGREWLVFDDVYTTGSTLLRAKELLYPMAQSRQIPLGSLSLFREGQTEK